MFLMPGGIVDRPGMQIINKKWILPSEGHSKTSSYTKAALDVVMSGNAAVLLPLDG